MDYYGLMDYDFGLFNFNGLLSIIIDNNGLNRYLKNDGL